MFQISFVLKIMAVILTVPVTGTIDLTPIDNTDDEWVAPGYEVITELEFDPLEYVDDVQAAQAFFMDTDDGEKLRLILVGDNRVLVFDEPWDTYREYAIESPWEVFRITFSRNGRFLAVRAFQDILVDDGYWEREEKAYQGFRIEITEDEIHVDQFNLRPVGVGSFYYLSNDGRITVSTARGVVGLHPKGDIEEYITREPSSIAWQRRSCSYDNSLITIGNTGNSCGERVIQGYDWTGNLLWETPIGDRNLTSLRVSPSGEYVLAPARNGGVMCYSGEDGSKLWETAEGVMCDFPQISPDGNRWIMSPDEIGHFYLYDGILGSSDDASSISASGFLSNTMNNPVCLSVSSCGNSLLWMHNSLSGSLLRMVYVNPDKGILWSSGKLHSRRYGFESACNTADYFRSTIAAISEEDNRICYTDYQSIKVLRFEGVE